MQHMLVMRFTCAIEDPQIVTLMLEEQWSEFTVRDVRPVTTSHDVEDRSRFAVTIEIPAGAPGTDTRQAVLRAMAIRDELNDAEWTNDRSIVSLSGVASPDGALDRLYAAWTAGSQRDQDNEKIRNSAGMIAV